MARAKIPDDQKCVKISISFTREQYEQLIAYGNRNERNISWIIRKALDKWFEVHKDDTIE